MKKLLLIAIVIIVSSSWTISNAQVRAGYKMGIDFSNMKMEAYGENMNDIWETKRLISPRLGFILEVGINDDFFVQTGILGSVKGFRYDAIREIDGKFFDSKEYQIMIALDIPVNFGYKYDLGDVKLIGMAGPTISYGIYATKLYKADDEYDNDHQSIGTKETDDFKPLNFGINVEGGIELDRFQITLFYNQGLSDLSNESDGSIKTNVFGLTAAVKFGSIR